MTDKDPFDFDAAIGFAVFALIAMIPVSLIGVIFSVMMGWEWLADLLATAFAFSYIIVFFGAVVLASVIALANLLGLADCRGGGGGYGASSSRAENLRPKHIQLRNALYSAQMSAETYAGPQPNPWALEVRDIEAELRLLESEMASGAAAQDSRLDRLRSKHNHVRSKYVRTLQQAMVYQGSSPNPYTIDARQMQAEMGLLEAEIARLR